MLLPQTKCSVQTILRFIIIWWTEVRAKSLIAVIIIIIIKMNCLQALYITKYEWISSFLSKKNLSMEDESY